MFRHSEIIPQPFAHRLVVALEAFFDESGKFHSGPVVSLACVVGNSGDLDAFNPAWGSALVRADLACLAAKEAFLTNKPLSSRIPAQTVSERIETLKPFIEAIQQHLQIGVIAVFDVKAYEAASKKVRHHFGLSTKDPIYAAFLRIVLELVGTVKHPQEGIGMVCDDEEQTAEPFYRYWRRLKKIDPKARKHLACLTFADDEVFPALQAADLLSSLSRLEARRIFFGEEYDWKPMHDSLVTTAPAGRFWAKPFYVGEAMINQLAASFVAAGDAVASEPPTPAEGQS